MKQKIFEILLSELLLLAVVTGLRLNSNQTILVLTCLNVFLTIVIGFVRIYNLFLNRELTRCFTLLLCLRLTLIVIQDSVSNKQLFLVLINHLEMQYEIKVALLVNYGLSSILNDVQNLIQTPQNVIYYVYWFLVLLQLKIKFFNVKEPKPQTISKSLKQIPDAPPTFQAKSQEMIKQLDEQSKVLSSSEIKPLQLNSNNLNEDDIIMTNMSWLSNQSVLIYNGDLSIIYQTFYLGKLQKNVGDKLDCELLFLDSIIIIGCKEINELLGQSGYSDSIFSDGSFLCNNINEVHKCKIKGQFTIRELITCLFKDFEKWRFFTLTIFKVKNDFLDLDGIQIKLFITNIDGHKFILFNLEQAPVLPKTNNSDSNSFLQNIYTTYSHESINYVNCIMTFILLLTHHNDSQMSEGSNKTTMSQSKKEKEEYVANSLLTMRYHTQRYTLFLYSMRDHIFYFQNELFFKMNAIRIEDLLDDLLQTFDPLLKLKQIKLTTSIELQEGNTIIFSDQDRIKQIISCLLHYCLQSSTKSSIKFDIKSYTLQGIMITIKDTKADFDETAKQKIINLTKLVNQQLKSQKSANELDLSNPLELQMCIILCWQLSGSFKRGLEFLIDSQGFCTFTFVIESQNTQMRYQNSDTGPIKVLGKKKYFETSLSLLLQDNINQGGAGGESRLLSFTQLSKQFSIKPTDPIDLQSAYFSQLSKIRQETSNSRVFPNSGTIHKQSREQSGSFSGTYKQGIQQDSIQQITKLLNRNNLSVAGKIDSPDESQRTFTAIDFGAAEQTINQISLPEFNPKLLTQVIKYRLRNNCCSKVLILDNDSFQIIVLEKVLQKYDIKCDYGFTGSEGLDSIEMKRGRPCHCGNRYYLLYFIDINLPGLSGIEFVQRIKKNMQQGNLDKGFAIATATVAGLNSKLDCFRNGMDYFISKPFDLIEISAAVQYLDF
ncbi:unnamed protein product (macronuclear) [Paramecium tetraurelia]|uniref:Response regulatory domain-containing protein n=1 Tax=Paramecium tetraurelia TaxID=5888 RepID=A0DTX9_PARTE|nr:uncharacterized protein GSPATT00020179001 [Paramecium tetraurelia]CAK86496.1 unnamed protein product [Paramecium tetraurelia]|eukprot:XP_001453893.1 hypothetical protein (macronuclear) [Paramecium tetraurelia strain d4-2]